MPEMMKPLKVRVPGMIKAKIMMGTIVIPETPVGATNPYALAGALALQKDDIKIDWENVPEDEIPGKLAEYLGPYENLFDPMDCPTLYQGLVPLPMTKMGIPLPKENRSPFWISHNPYRDALIRSVLEKTGTKTPESGGDSGFSVIRRDDFFRLAAAGAFLEIPPDSDLTKRTISLTGAGSTQLLSMEVGHSPTGGTSTTGAWAPLGTWFTNVNTTNDILKEVIDDHLQGAVPDCFLIAAMTAWFWKAWPAGLPSKAAVSASYNVAMYNPDGSRPDLTVTKDLPKATTGATIPVYAKLTAANEMYPCIYEKEYAKLRNCPNWGSTTHPDISKLQGGNPLEALHALSQMQYTWSGANPTAYYTVTHAELGLTGLDNAQNLTRFLSQFSAEGKALYPMVAWTYYTGGNYAPPADRVAAPSNVRYVADWMVANHTYAVLGLVKPNMTSVSPAPAANYVILRNPFGPTYGGKPSMVNYPENPVPGGIISQTTMWSPKPGSSYSLNIGQVTGADGKTKPDGIFAMRLDQFRLYFESVGWVV